ncbi:MAG: NTPase [bacterium]
MKNILLTGLPAVGKTTIIKNVVGLINKPYAGFYTEEIRKDNERVGFRLITFDNKSCTLAQKSLKSPYYVGKYGVDIRCIEDIGVCAIRQGLLENKIIIIDEIGKMELFSAQFRKIVLEALDSKSSVLGTIRYRPEPFCDIIKNRNDVKIIEVTLENRQNLALDIVNIL